MEQTNHTPPAVGSIPENNPEQPSRQKNLVGKRANIGLRKFFHWFRRRKPAKDSNSIETLINPFDKLEKIFETTDQDLLNEKIQNRIHAEERCMLENGWRDGALGIKSESIKQLADAKATEIVNDAMNHARKVSLSAYKSSWEEKKTKRDQGALACREQEDYFKYYEFGYRYFPKKFSIILGLIYAITSLLLFAADIPMALQLLDKGLGFVGGGHNKIFSHLAEGNIGKALGDNLEVIITALGIASCSIYLKMMYDEYMGLPYGHRFVTRHNFSDLFRSKPEKTKEGLDEQSLQTVEKEENIKSRWKWSIAVFTLLGLLVIAIFRITILQKGEQEGAQKGWLAILVITLLFPIMSGICLSLAITCFQNRWRYFRALAGFTKQQKNYAKLVSEELTSEHKFNLLNNRLNNATTAQTLETQLAELFLAHYQYGCEVGRAEPDKYNKGEDFFEKIVFWQQKAIAQKINQHVFNIK